MVWRTPALICLLSGLCGPALADAFDLPPDLGSAAGPGGGAVAAFPLTPPALSPAPPQPSAAIETAERSDSLVLEGRLTHADALRGGESGSFRASAQWMGHKRLGPDLRLRFNLRARATGVDGESFSLDDDLRLDAQELALIWQARPGLSFDLGRVNLRNGVAQGFNPTDWFKAASLVTSDSADPGDRRLERLGTLMLAGHASLGADLLSFGYRPKISASGNDLLAGQDVFGLHLDRTNPSEAAFVQYAPDTGGNLNLTASLLFEDDTPGVGLEVSGAVGTSLVLYAEAFAQRRDSLAAMGLQEASAGLRAATGAGAEKSWRGQVALGADWALPEALVAQREVSLTLEYHYNGAGLSADQLAALAAAGGADLAAAGTLRSLSSERQEPLAREQIFARIAWNNLWQEADLSVIGFYVPADDSSLVQVSAAFPLGDRTELSLRAAKTFGDDSSTYGANPTRTTTQLALRYTF